LKWNEYIRNWNYGWPSHYIAISRPSIKEFWKCLHSQSRTNVCVVIQSIFAGMCRMRINKCVQCNIDGSYSIGTVYCLAAYHVSFSWTPRVHSIHYKRSEVSNDSLCHICSCTNCEWLAFASCPPLICSHVQDVTVILGIT
jgi:hypothetical protein